MCNPSRVWPHVSCAVLCEEPSLTDCLTDEQPTPLSSIYSSTRQSLACNNQQGEGEEVRAADQGAHHPGALQVHNPCINCMHAEAWVRTYRLTPGACSRAHTHTQPHARTTPTNSVENEMLTQKLSIKRHLVVKKYEREIEALYSSGERIVWPVCGGGGLSSMDQSWLPDLAVNVTWRDTY